MEAPEVFLEAVVGWLGKSLASPAVAAPTAAADAIDMRTAVVDFEEGPVHYADYGGEGGALGRGSRHRRLAPQLLATGA